MSKRYRHSTDDILKREEAWRKLTPRQQLDKLDERLGIGVGARQQRARLLRSLLKKPSK